MIAEASGALYLETIWWLGFWLAVGLAVGSFLNVVIYRIPREKSLRSPLFSACPSCSRRIAWYDNIPVVSFVLLRGRCRQCSVPIPVRYIVVELTMAIVVLALLDGLFISETREGLRTGLVGLTDQLAYDWPILLAHILLFGCLLALSVIDLEHYWIDIRFTNIVTIAAFVLHAFWTPRHSSAWPRPDDSTAIVCLFTLGGLLITWIVLVCQAHVEPEDLGPEYVTDPEDHPVAADASVLPPSLRAPRRTAAWIIAGTLVLLLALMFIDSARIAELKHTGRGLLVCALLFGLIVSESAVARDSDEAIVNAIDDERHESRRMVLDELVLFLPAILLGCVGLWLARSGSEVALGLSTALHDPVHVGGTTMFNQWTPLQGLATAASGYVIAGALGWTVRIGFTLAFGKEAFGSGDIHMMAAAGAVAGWPVVVIGFVLTCGLALFGWLVTLPFKQTRAIPLGPWLALGFVVAVLFYQPLVRWPFVARTVEAADYLLHNNSQPRRLGIQP